MAKQKYRGKKHHRPAHPTIYIWSHTKRAEIEYFQEFKNHLGSPLLMPKKELCGTPQELIAKVVEWKADEICDEDNDQVWCIFDVDDFFKQDSKKMLKMIKVAHENNIKIAYINECFELWILFHFEKPTNPVPRGDLERKIIAFFKKKKLGSFIKNQKVFGVLLPFQGEAIKNSEKILGCEKYEDIGWQEVLGQNGNPSTSIHFLIKEINELIEKR